MKTRNIYARLREAFGDPIGSYAGDAPVGVRDERMECAGCGMQISQCDCPSSGTCPTCGMMPIGGECECSGLTESAEEVYTPQDEMMDEPEICPDCKGLGRLSRATPRWPNGKICKRCDGTGELIDPEEPSGSMEDVINLEASDPSCDLCDDEGIVDCPECGGGLSSCEECDGKGFVPCTCEAADAAEPWNLRRRGVSESVDPCSECGMMPVEGEGCGCTHLEEAKKKGPSKKTAKKILRGTKSFKDKMEKVSGWAEDPAAAAAWMTKKATGKWPSQE